MHRGGGMETWAAEDYIWNSGNLSSDVPSDQDGTPSGASSLTKAYQKLMRKLRSPSSGRNKALLEKPPGLVSTTTGSSSSGPNTGLENIHAQDPIDVTALIRRRPPPGDPVQRIPTPVAAPEEEPATLSASRLSAVLNHTMPPCLLGPYAEFADPQEERAREEIGGWTDDDLTRLLVSTLSQMNIRDEPPEEAAAAPPPPPPQKPATITPLHQHYHHQQQQQPHLSASMQEEEPPSWLCGPGAVCMASPGLRHIRLPPSDSEQYRTESMLVYNGRSLAVWREHFLLLAAADTETLQKYLMCPAMNLPSGGGWGVGGIRFPSPHMQHGSSGTLSHPPSRASVRTVPGGARPAAHVRSGSGARPRGRTTIAGNAAAAGGSTRPPPSEGRFKQIARGKSTTEYLEYIKAVPFEKRRPESDPVTPKVEGSSWREFQAEVRAWKRSLHRKYESLQSQGLVQDNNIAGGTDNIIQ